MGKKGKKKGNNGRSGSGEQPVDRNSLAECLSATSQIAAECNSILRDLLRGRSPQQQDLQRLASQVLMGQTVNLQDLQKKMESQQATLAELLKMLKPGQAEAAGLTLNGVNMPYNLPQPSLSVIKGWDSSKDTHAAQQNRQQRRNKKGAGGGNNNAAATKSVSSMSKRDRYLAVEGYWKQLSPEERRKVLQMPVSEVLKFAAAEGGNEVRKEVSDGIRLLKHNESKHACFWRCPCCNMRTADSEAFLSHLSTYHEEVQYSVEETPLLCTACGNEIVGGYVYAGDNPQEPSNPKCLLCCWENGNSVGSPPQGQKLYVPTPSPFLTRIWSESGSSDDDDDDDEDYHSESGSSKDGKDGASSCDSALPSLAGSSDGSDLPSLVDSGSESDAGLPSLVDDDEETDEENDGEGQKNGKKGRIKEKEDDALEQRIKNGADGLLAAIARRVDELAKADRSQFDAALANVVRRAQKFMHGISDAQKATLAANSTNRKAAVAIICTLPPPGQDGVFTTQQSEAVLREAVNLLTPSELQDLLALMARKYSPHANHRRRRSSSDSGESGSESETDSDGSSESSVAYEPVCWSLLQVIGKNGAPAQSPANGRSSSQQNAAQKKKEQGDEAHSEHASNGQEEDDEVPPPPPPPPGAGFDSLPELDDTDIIDAQSWWSEHLAQKSFHDLGSSDDIYLLQWIFGNVAYGATDEFFERQRLACRGRTLEQALVDLFIAVAETWRHLAATLDRKRHINTLREAVTEDIAAVSTFDPELVNALRKQSNAFFDEVSTDPALKAAAEGQADMDAAWSQRALGKLQRYHELKDEGSIRYAQALIDREIAVLELAEVMDQHQLDVAERELSNVEAALQQAKQDLADVEAEYNRAQSEGPQLHRKRDLLDRVNKEAEHRERMQELQQQIAAIRERISSEEAFGTGAQKRREQAATDLDEGRTELQSYLERRQTLDKACHAVLAAQERDKGQELTEEYVDQRIKAVWQVVAGVADAIRSLSDRYSRGQSNTKEHARHSRSVHLAEALLDELDDRISVWWEELDKYRSRFSDLACVDAGQAVEHATLEAIRHALEERAAAAREAAVDDLLRELEAEEQAAKKAAESKKSKKKKKSGAKEPASKESSAVTAATGDAKNKNKIDDGQEVESKPVPEKDVDSEEEYEAALERRRLELERQEQELIRQAQEASLKENAAKAAAAAAAAASSSGQNGTRPSPKIVPIPISRTRPGSAQSSSSSSTAAAAPGEKPAPRVVLVHRSSNNTAPNAQNRPKSVVEIIQPNQYNKSGHLPPPTAPSTAKPLSINTKPTTAASTDTSPTPQESGEMRIITYYGDWICHCNRTNRLWDTCVCSQIPPCRDWVRGRCTYKNRCRFAHPPFELPDSLPRPKSPIAKPGPDALVYRKASKSGALAAAAAAAAAGGERIHNVPSPGQSAPLSMPSARSSMDQQQQAYQPLPSMQQQQQQQAAPAPLKPAPWAAARSGAVEQPYQQQQQQPQYQQQYPEQQPMATVAYSGISDSQPYLAPPQQHQQQQPPRLSEEFNPFGGSSLLSGLDAPSLQNQLAPQGAGHPSASSFGPDNSPAALTSAFPSLSLGPSFGNSMASASPASPAATSRLFGGSAHQSGGGFVSTTGLGSDTAYQQPSFDTSFTNSYQAGPQTSSTSAGTGLLSGFNEAFGGLDTLGFAPQPGVAQDDDWADLSLQLPSDLGELLGGSDLGFAASDQPPQQQQQQQQQQQNYGANPGYYNNSRNGWSGF